MRFSSSRNDFSMFNADAIMRGSRRVSFVFFIEKKHGAG